MASITRRASSAAPWQVRYRGADGVQRSRQFARRADAEAFLVGMEHAKRSGTWIAPDRSRVSVAEWCDRWRNTKVDLRRSTLARLDGTLRVHVLPEFGARPLASVGNADVRAWVARMIAEGRSPTTVRKAFFALHDMLAAAVADRRLAHNPADAVPLPTEPQHEQRFLAAGEVAALADAINPRFRAMVLVAAYGGLRFGELAALRRGRVDLLRGRVAVAETLVDVDSRLTFGPPKTKNGRRIVPLPRRVVAALDAHMAAYVAPGEDALVFTGTTGKPLRRSRFRQGWWLPAAAAAGLAELRFHDLRHTFVALSIAAGADPKRVSVRAGHSSVAFTLDRYGHLYEDDEDQVTARLDALLDGPEAASPTAVRRLLA